MSHLRRVRKYYNRNTRRFLQWGSRGETGAIHREIWGPNVHSRRDAQLYLNRLAAETIRNSLRIQDEDIRTLDLGCGVGGTTIWLARKLGVEVVGMSLSDIQIRFARDSARAEGVEDLCTFQVRDFHDLSELGQFHCAIAIESFMHTEEPERLFSELDTHLRDGGIFILCDDMQTESSGKNFPASREKWMRRFKRGWRLGNLLTESRITALAREYGFQLIESSDLTPYIRLKGHLGFMFSELLYLLPFTTAYIDNLRGGNAGQKCLKKGWTEYRYLVFRHSPQTMYPG